MKWLIEKLPAALRAHRAVVTAAATALVDLANGLPLLHAVARALGGLLAA